MRLANLIEVRPCRRNRHDSFNRIAAKCVDFILCDERDTRPLLVVELDDSSHRRPDRQARDAFVDAALRSADLPILHVPWQPRYDSAKLAAAIRDLRRGAAVRREPLRRGAGQGAGGGGVALRSTVPVRISVAEYVSAYLCKCTAARAILPTAIA